MVQLRTVPYGANQEKYQDAIDKLNLTQYRWTFKTIRQQVNNKVESNKKLLDDQNNFNSGNTLFGESKWAEAKDRYSKVSDKYSHYKEAQDKIAECQKKIDEANAQAEKDKQTEAQKAKQLSIPATKPATTDTQNPSSNSQNQTDYNNCVQKVIALYDTAQKKFLDVLNDSYLGCGVNSTCRAEAFAGYNVYRATLETENNNNLTKCAAQYPH